MFYLQINAGDPKKLCILKNAMQYVIKEIRQIKCVCHQLDLFMKNERDCEMICTKLFQHQQSDSHCTIS